MYRLLPLLILIPILMGADCDVSVLPENNRLIEYEMEDGETTESLPGEIPWYVVADESIEHPDAFERFIARMNAWHAPYTVFEGEINQALFDELDLLRPEERDGYILFWVGGLPLDSWPIDGEAEGPGGVASLYRDEYGVIRACDIVIGYQDAYHEQTFEDRSIHEGGHCLGYAHDGDSMDLGSCMSSPPPYGCRILADDVEYWQEAWRLSNR